MHFGDNLTGEGSGDDETIEINLKQVPKQVTTLWLTITIYTDSKTFS